MAYFTLNDDGIAEQHTGEVADTPTDYKKMMLDYGWIPPVAYGSYKLAEPLIDKGIAKTRDYLKSRKLGKQEKGVMSFGDEGIIDVPSRDVTEQASVAAKAPTTKQNPLDVYAQQKHGYPLSELEAFSQGPLTKQADIDIIANTYKRGNALSINPLSGTVSNQPAGVPSGVSPMSQLRGQPTTPAPVSVADAVAGGVNPTQAVTQTIAQEIDAAPTELRTGTGKPAFAGQGPVAPVSKKGKTQFYENYGSLAEVPSTHAFIPNAQYIDPVRQDLGPKAYKEAYTVRNFPASNEIAREEAKTINRELGRATREEAKLAGLPPAEITPGITEKTTKGYKKVAVGGLGVGALVALPNLANAAQQGDAKAAAEAIGYAIPGISHLLSIRDINNAYKEGGWPAAAHMAADVASMGGLSGAEHLLSYVPKQKTEVPSINKPRLGAVPPAFSQFYR